MRLRAVALLLQAVAVGALVVGVAAGKDLWTTEPPDLLYLALFTLP